MPHHQHHNATHAATGVPNPPAVNPPCSIATRTRLHTLSAETRHAFITEAISNGMPPHICQLLADHKEINVTMNYNTIYPQQAINAHRDFIARRRALRPADEYRPVTDAEWNEFRGHREGEEFVPFVICGRAVFLAGAGCPASCDEGAVRLDGFGGVDGLVAHGGADVAMAADA